MYPLLSPRAIYSPSQAEKHMYAYLFVILEYYIIIIIIIIFFLVSGLCFGYHAIDENDN